MNRLERMPVPVLPTFVGALTLSNVYAGIGYAWVRHLTMWAATVIILLYLIKIGFRRPAAKNMTRWSRAASMPDLPWC